MPYTYQPPNRQLPQSSVEVNPAEFRTGNAIMATNPYFALQPLPNQSGKYCLYCVGEDGTSIENTPNDVLVAEVYLSESGGVFTIDSYVGPSVAQAVQTNRENLYVTIATALYNAGYNDGRYVTLSFV